MEKAKPSKYYDLEERTLKFAKEVRTLIRKLPKSITIIEDSKQLTKASGSVGANYIEANEAVSKKDFIYRIKISRKEAKESIYFLRLLDIIDNDVCEDERKRLIVECTQLMKIFGAIIEKSK